jgi:glycosyltransferase involved in cell wall biosynthesis
VKSAPLVTIVIPVYNGSNYLAVSLASALSQTYEKTEIIVVNDGSTDNGASESIALRHKNRIKYIAQENKGVAGALNTAMRHMTGDFFAWLSHDDIHLPQKTARQVAYHRQLGSRNATLFSDYYLIDPDGEVFQEVKWTHSEFIKTPRLPLLRGRINGCTLFVPTHILEEFGPFDEGLRYTQDYELWNKCQSKSDLLHQPETLIKYRVHPGQDSHKELAVTEGDALWIRMMESRGEVERAQISGSSKKFLLDTADFLAITPYHRAQAWARERAKKAERDTLVSVVIPFFNEIHLAIRAAQSVLAQTHAKLELLLVDDGSTEPTDALRELARADRRVKLIRQENAGPGAARNHGMRLARGDYIAFLDADDLFLPHKLQRQIAAMQDAGAVASHTSYHVSFPERFSGLGTLNSGSFGGAVYPAIMSGCPIATPTVMLHRSLVSEGFAFPVDSHLGEDVLSWIWVAQRHEVLGVPEPLSIVEWSTTSAAINLDKSVAGLSFVLHRLKVDPLHSSHTDETGSLDRLLTEVSNLRRARVARRDVVDGEPILHEDLIAWVFQKTP